jgi:dual specificity phosphatase 12
MICRVAIVGSHVIRVAKVLALIKEILESTILPSNIESIEVLPLLASFDSYHDDKGNKVRYLSHITYHGLDGKQRGTSIAQFYDSFQSEDDGDDKGKLKLPPISIIAIGIGIEEESDINAITAFFSTMSGGNMEGILIRCISPNPEFATMEEETKAFLQLDEMAKHEALLQQTIGPSKMAKFVMELISEYLKPLSIEEPNEAVTAEETNEIEQMEDTTSIQPHFIDEKKERYACRICRTILWGEDDLEDPPHEPSRHQFSYRKQQPYGMNRESTCQSIFLHSGMPWMGDISVDYEGKFCCPTCGSKLGIWKWAGAQCSCGTWVTPAIQIPSSKVDVLRPENDDS